MDYVTEVVPRHRLIFDITPCTHSIGNPIQTNRGDIHKYSANSIEKVKIEQGNDRPLKIEIHMKAEVGFFQVEEVLIPKIQSSPAKNLLELYAGVDGEDMKRYI